MNEFQLDEIVRRLHINLPELYRRLMLFYPLVGQLKNKSSYAKLLNDSLDIVIRNESLRDSGFLGKGWNKHNFLIGYVWSEKLNSYYTIYFIDTRKPDGVWAVNVKDSYNPDRIGNLKSNNTLDEFVEMIKMHDSL